VIDATHTPAVPGNGEPRQDISPVKEQVVMIVDIDPKSMASRLRKRLAVNGAEITHGQALELVAAQLGYRDWNTCAAAPETAPAPVTVSILRTFPGPEARRFYVDFLGFTVDWEHRFGEGMPLYQQVSREGCVLHLSEHHGDATPGSAVRIEISDVRRLQRELAESSVYPLRIGFDRQPWGDDLAVPDPFGNRIIFHTPRTTADDTSQHD
jgi:uncharacterized glyoxalase superfamily protein PhnB